jgi:repressor LexA
MEKLTPRQQQALDYITDFLDSHGYPPTMREIGLHLGISGNVSVIAHLNALERKGYLKRESGSSRSIVLSNRTARPGASHLSGTPVSLPIVGTVRAGLPEPAIEDIQGYFMIDPSWIKGEGCFLLRIKGDSMKDAGIFDGDIGLVRPQQTAENGEVVIAMINGEATMKRFFREADHIRLQPENSTMEPIIIREGEGEAEAVIVGRVLKTIRFFD